MNRKLLTAFCLAAALPLLQGCIGAAVTATGAAVLMADDRRTAGVYVEDENVEWKALDVISRRHSNAHVNATSYNLKVLLTGEAPDETTKREIEEKVRAIPNVKNVTNELVVAGNSSLTSRGNDSLITSNVKSRMIANTSISPNHVKVVTEAGVVYLMGLVTQEEGDQAVEVTRTTSGVSRVVKAFEYIKP